VTSKSGRKAAREAIASYHEAQPGQLIARASDGVDGFRTGQLDAFDVDRILFQYSRAAKELWKFCTLGDAEFTASLLLEHAPIDWWQRGAPKRQ